MNSKKKITTYQLCMCALFVALISIGGMYFKIVIPNVVTWSFQYEVTLLAGLLLGGNLGALSVIIYIILGLIGVPVFAEGGGFYYVFKPTFGYLIGFIISTYVTGKIANTKFKPSMKRLLAANFTGMAITYLIGVPFYIAAVKLWVENSTFNLNAILKALVIMPLPKDIICCVLAALICIRLLPLLPGRSEMIDKQRTKKSTS